MAYLCRTDSVIKITDIPVIFLTIDDGVVSIYQRAHSEFNDSFSELVVTDAL